MTGTAFAVTVAAAAASAAPVQSSTAAPAVFDDRTAEPNKGSPQQAAVLTPRPPASKKIKLSGQWISPSSPQQPAGEQDSSGLRMSGRSGDVEMGGTEKDKAVQTAPVSETATVPRNSENTPSLLSIRQTISEQFDLEILLKHREILTIEQEIAKTQVAIEQLRRCAILPYSESPEAQLLALQGYKPPSSNPYHIPGYAPPPPGVVDGPYTRHYRQWLVPDQRFDGPSVAPVQQPGVVMNGVHQSLSNTGRPQRQSAMKAQTKTGEQVCLYRRKDGVLVRLECGACHRSNFCSAQGFINHCRIAHQTEYASHDAAAEACGKEVDEAEQAALVSPMNRTVVDGPARNTRQTQVVQNQYPTPQSSFAGGSTFSSEFPASNAYIAPRTLSKDTPAAQRKGGRRSGMTVNASKTPAPQGKSVASPISSLKTDFNTPNLQVLLKRKRPDINVQEMVKEVAESRIDWDRAGSLESGAEDDTVFMKGQTNGFSSRAPVTGLRNAQSAGRRTGGDSTLAPRVGSPAFRQQISGMPPVPSHRYGSPEAKTHQLIDGDVGMIDDFDSSSSSDEEDGYRSDGGNDDDLYTAPPRRPLQGEALDFRNDESSTFSTSLLNTGASGLFTQYNQYGLTPSATPSPTSPGFPPHNVVGTLFNGGSTLLNGGGIPPAAPAAPAVTINPAVLMRNDNATSNAVNSLNAPNSPSMTDLVTLFLSGQQQLEPEIPKHVRFAIPGIGGTNARQEGVNGASG